MANLFEPMEIDKAWIIDRLSHLNSIETYSNASIVCETALAYYDEKVHLF